MNQAVSPPACSRQIEADGFQCLVFNEDKPGTPVILVHGLLCSIYFWYPRHLDVFGNRPVYSIVLPGHYPSRPLQANTRITADWLALSVLKQVEALIGKKPCILVGHSTGAQAVLLAAARAPAQVKAVIAIGGALSGKEEGGIYAAFQWVATKFGAFGRALVGPALRINGLSMGIHKIFLRDVVADPHAFFQLPDTADYLSYYFPALQQISGSSMSLYFRDLGNLELEKQMRDVRCPSLVLAGTQDPYVSPKRTKDLAMAIEHSELTLIEHSGHLPMFENWPAYSAAITDFLGKLKHRTEAPSSTSEPSDYSGV